VIHKVPGIIARRLDSMRKDIKNLKIKRAILLASMVPSEELRGNSSLGFLQASEIEEINKNIENLEINLEYLEGAE